MNIYLDESYNLQKERGKMFISINGFSVLDDKALRKRWRAIRKSFTGFGRRIHATDSHFDKLREKSIRLLGGHDANILSVFQLMQEIPHDYFDKDGMEFDSVYVELLKKLFIKLSLGEYKKVRIVIDERKYKGGLLWERAFRVDIENFLKREFSNTICIFKTAPSFLDILVELADFVSNIFYREYKNGQDHVFKKLGFRFKQIKNPL